jgi:pyruvate,water dikinase
MVLAAELPDDLLASVTSAYQSLEKQYSNPMGVTVRLCSTEVSDLCKSIASGRDESSLKVEGLAAVVAAVKQWIAGLMYVSPPAGFSLVSFPVVSAHPQCSADAVLSLSGNKAAFDPLHLVSSAICVQKWVRCDNACRYVCEWTLSVLLTGSLHSGIVFAEDADTGLRDACLIVGAWGLVENVASGIGMLLLAYFWFYWQWRSLATLSPVNPDEFRVSKPTTKPGSEAAISKKLGCKEQKV